MNINGRASLGKEPTCSTSSSSQVTHASIVKRNSRKPHTTDSCIGAAHSAVQPAPTATVAASIDLGTNQFFDVTALIQEVQETRQHENNRPSFVVRIHDGSLDNATQKVKAMPLTVYWDTAPTRKHASGASWKPFLEDHLQRKTAVSFFCISGSQSGDSKFCFRTTRNTIIDKGLGTKADKLTATRRCTSCRSKTPCPSTFRQQDRQRIRQKS